MPSSNCGAVILLSGAANMSLCSALPNIPMDLGERRDIVGFGQCSRYVFEILRPVLRKSHTHISSYCVTTFAAYKTNIFDVHCEKYIHVLSPIAWKILEHFWPSAPKPSGTSSAICAKTLWTSSAFGPRTLRNLVCYLRRSPPEPAGTSSTICPGTLRNPHQLLQNLIRYPPRNHNLISHLHRNPPELHRPSAPEPSGTFSRTWCCSARAILG